MNENMQITEKKQNKIITELIDWAKSIVGAFIFVLILFGFVISSVRVDGSSMVPTLHHGDRLIAYKLMYTPKPNDVVILDEDSGLNTKLVKRVIAVEGQTVSVLQDGSVEVDGVKLSEPYISEAINSNNIGFHDYPVQVPENCIFVMGDNRNHSTDSRAPAISFVSEENVIGKVVFRVFPFSDIGIVH